MQEAAIGTQQVTLIIVGVIRTERETGTAAERVLTASSDLSGQAEQLASEVSTFAAGVRAA